MPSLFKEHLIPHGPFKRINVLSPETPATAGHPLKPCRLAAKTIEVRAWSRRDMATYVKNETRCWADLYRVVEDNEDEKVLPYRLYNDEEPRVLSSSAAEHAATMLYVFTDEDLLVIREPGTYYYRFEIRKRFSDGHTSRIAPCFTFAEIIVEPAAEAEAEPKSEAERPTAQSILRAAVAQIQGGRPSRLVSSTGGIPPQPTSEREGHPDTMGSYMNWSDDSD